MRLNLESTNQPLRLIQITDCHLGEQLLGLDTDESLIDVLHLIEREQPNPDLVLATGDIAGCSELSAYTRFLALTDEQLTAPMAWLPGNHDTPSVMAQALNGRPMPRVITTEFWVLVLLDSSVRGVEHGDLVAEELAFLDQTLSEYADRHAMIFLHHQPVPVGSQWVDQYVVRSAEAFFNVVDRHKQVKGIVWGHVHQAFYGQRKAVSLWATPSTCVQFKPNCDNFTVDRTMPGYRWFDLHPDGQVVSQVSRVASKPYAIDYASSGY